MLAQDEPDLNNTYSYSSSNTYVYRSFNGDMYRSGSTVTVGSKSHQGDVVTLTLNMKAKTLSIKFADGSDKVWTDLPPGPMYPLIVFYSSNIKARIMSVRCKSGGGGGGGGVEEVGGGNVVFPALALRAVLDAVQVARGGPGAGAVGELAVGAVTLSGAVEPIRAVLDARCAARTVWLLVLRRRASVCWSWYLCDVLCAV